MGKFFRFLSRRRKQKLHHPEREPMLTTRDEELRDAAAEAHLGQAERS